MANLKQNPKAVNQIIDPLNLNKEIGFDNKRSTAFDFEDSLHKKLETADLVTFAEEILNGKLHFLCSVYRFSMYTLRFSYLYFRLRNQNVKLSNAGIFLPDAIYRVTTKISLRSYSEIDS